MLTSKEIERQIKEGNISVEGMLQSALSKPNSCDISIENTLYTHRSKITDPRSSHVYKSEILTDTPHLLERVNIPESGMLLEAGKLYLARSKEKITTNGHIPTFNGKVRNSMMGVHTELTNVIHSDEFNDYIIFTIVCVKPTIIYPNMKMGNMAFFESFEIANRNIGMLSGSEIQKRLDEGRDIIIENKENIVINPNSVNLTLNENIGYYTEPVIDLIKDNNVDYLKIDNDNGLLLKNTEIYLGRTNEWTETNNLIPMISGRSSLGRLGLHVHNSAAMGSIGYKGYWHLGIKPIIPIVVQNNMKCCQVYYFTPEGDYPENYNGFLQDVRENPLEKIRKK